MTTTLIVVLTLLIVTYVLVMYKVGQHDGRAQARAVQEVRESYMRQLRRAWQSSEAYYRLLHELPPEARDIHYRVLWLKDCQVQLVSEIERMPQAQRDRLQREVQRLEMERRSLDEECERLDARLREGR